MHIMYTVYYTAYLRLSQYIIRIRDSTTTTAKIVTGNKRTSHTRLIMRNKSSFL
jgi:hypothetical protein